MTIKVYCCYTKAHEPLLRDYFLPSIPNDARVIAIPLDIEGQGDFLSREFIDCINRKIALIQESLEREHDAVIVWSDIDIIFFRDFAREVVRFMNEHQLDIAFQKEGFGDWDSEVNTGFVVMRTNQKVRDFYRDVAAELQGNPEKNEQPVINELLGRGVDLAWKMLPVHFTAKSHAWPPMDDISLYHANVTVGEGGVRKKIDQFREVRKIRREAPVNVCLVSPEVIGPRTNSGIGTHAYHFLKLLASDPGVDVTFLLTGEIRVPMEGGWDSWFREHLNVRFVHLNPLPHPYPLVGWFNYWFNMRSLQVFNYLRRENFKVIHFQDLNGDGFVCHQARKTGLAFQNTVFTTMVNGPAKWAREGMKQFAQDVVYESMLNFVESYPLANTDIVIAPSQYAFDYVEKECGWKLSGEKALCPYMIETPSIETESGDAEPALIFFGRLETRKGIHLFLKALEFLDREASTRVPRKVIFIGSHAETPLGPSRHVIPDYFRNKLPAWTYEIYSQWDQPECMEYLAAHKESLIVLPSIAETLGYVAIECFQLGLNVIGSRTGAFPEVFASDDRLFENNPRAICSKIKQAFSGELSPSESRYDAALAREKWAAVHERSLKLLLEKGKAVPHSIPGQPLVSICLPYFNYGQYIKEQVQSIRRQTYPEWELIFINDGSTDHQSIQVFEQLKQELGNDQRIRFYEQENKGLCITRNRAASLARGQFLVFCDADNISKPQMLERLVTAIQASGADCVTSHFEKFRIDPDGNRIQLDHYTPVGACVEAGPFVDPYGDVNGIVRKEVFEKLGGFRHVPNTASEDWEFFSELCLSGYSLEVVPEDLFEYREHGESNMRNTSFYDTRQRTLYPYLKRLDKRNAEILVATMGAWETNLRQRRHTADRIRKLEQDLEQLRGDTGAARSRIEESERQLDQSRGELEKCRLDLENSLKELEKIRQNLGDMTEDRDLLNEKIRHLKNNFIKRLLYRLLER